MQLRLAKNKLPSLAALTLLICAPSANAQFVSRTEAFFNVGDLASYLGARTMLPVYNSDTSALFVEARLSAHKSLYNYSLGGLWRSASPTAAYGYYLGIDARRSKTDNLHKQVSLGFERLGQTFDVRALAYVPISSEFQTSKFAASSDKKTEFIGDKIQQRIIAYRPSGYVLEESLSGGHLEVGSLIPSSTRLEMRAYIGGYAYISKVMDNILGSSARLSAQPTDNVNVNISLQHDKLFSTRMSLDVAWAFGRSSKNNLIRTPQQRANDFFARNPAIIETSQLDSDKRTIYGAESQLVGTVETIADAPKSIAHIDNSKAAGGDGSIEKPYNSIQACQSGSCKTAEAIFIHQGKSVALKDNKLDANQNSSSPYIGNLTLNNKQKLYGDGVQNGILAKLATGYSPVVLGAKGSTQNSIVAAGNDSLIQGLRFGWHYGVVDGANSRSEFVKLPNNAKMPSNAIAVNGKQNVTISNVVVTGYTSENIKNGSYANNNFSNGLDIRGNSHVVVRNSVFTAANKNAINMQASAGQKQSVVLAGVNLTRNGTGINLYADNATQTLSMDELKSNDIIYKNKIEASNNEGILAIGKNGASQKLKIYNSQIMNNIGAGVYASFAAGTDRKASTLTFKDSFLIGNSGGGMSVVSHAGETAINVDNSVLIGNIASVNNFNGNFNTSLDGKQLAATNKRNAATGIGIYLKNSAAAGVESIQSAAISNKSQIKLHQKSQIYMQSAAAGTSNQVLTIDSQAADGINTSKGILGADNKVIADTASNITRLTHFDGKADGLIRRQEMQNQAKTMLERKNGKYLSEQDLKITSE